MINNRFQSGTRCC